MAELSTEDRGRIWRGFMRSKLPEKGTAGYLKSELLTTVNETDTWVNDNQASFNSSLTYAGKFTTMDKSLILCAVVLARVSIDVLRMVFGRVD